MPFVHRTLRTVYVCLMLVVVWPLTASAQSAEEEAVEAVIVQLFDGMRASDSTMVRAVFHPGARMRSVGVSPEGQAVVRQGSVDAFVSAVGQPKAEGEIWDERIWDVEVRVDGPMADAWVPYAFYRGDQFSHCGVNSFQFVETEAGWQVVTITDTRRREGCEIPDDVAK